jgi:hypothetical protein
VLTRVRIIKGRGSELRVGPHPFSQKSGTPQFRARFDAKGLGFQILYHTPITTAHKHISEKIYSKFDCNPPLAPNRTLSYADS